MKVRITQAQPTEADADLFVVGLYEGGELPAALHDAAGAPEARGGFKKLSTVHPASPARALVIGLGKRGDFDPERARVVAALAAKQAGALGAASLAWLLPDCEDGEAIAAALVTGTILGA
ncbi:MAG: M17 family peptidase N-terminal domain-containing protein, partial [Solirubrobacterales bacterium]